MSLTVLDIFVITIPKDFLCNLIEKSTYLAL